MAHHGRKNADEALLLALACGATVEHAAAKAGISRRTATRRLDDPEFRRLQEHKADLVHRSAAALTAGNLEAIKTLLSLLAAGSPPAVRLGAARAILDLSMRLREAADTEERLAALEAQLASQQAA